MRPVSRATGVLVVIPAHNEAQLIASCLTSVRNALSDPRLKTLTTRVVVVADSCTDDTVGQAVRGWTARSPSGCPAELVVHIAQIGSAAAARQEGWRRAMRDWAVPLSQTWVLSTDADSTVPGDWLSRHLKWANHGFDGVAGTIRVGDWATCPPHVRSTYTRMLTNARRGDRHVDVFGANLGVRGSALQAMGGFPEVTVGEDHVLWQTLESEWSRTHLPRGCRCRHQRTT